VKHISFLARTARQIYAAHDHHGIRALPGETGAHPVPGEDVTSSPVYQRARMGLGLAFQRPPTIRGMQTRDLLAACGAGKRAYEALVRQYDFSPFLDREVNYGFSGGELKRSELLQLLFKIR